MGSATARKRAIPIEVFHLSKWYLDCTADDGSTLIGYWAQLRWRSFRIQYAAALAAPAGAPSRQFHALRGVDPPVLEGSRCSWRCQPIRLEGNWEAEAAPIEQELLRSDDGRITWRCFQPRARAQVRLGLSEAGGAGSGPLELTGLGYVEHLEMTILPWRLPFNTLYWGRFLSEEHALVWLQWQSSSDAKSHHRFAILDGVVEEQPEITEQGVRLPSLGADLHFERSRTLREGDLAATVLGAVPGLSSLLPASFARAHEVKRLSRGPLVRPGQEPSNGWSIHEVVTW